MIFTRKIWKNSGLTQYGWAKKVGISLQSAQYILGVTAKPRTRKAMDLRVLCKLRRASGLSWNQLGRMLDDEFTE